MIDIPRIQRKTNKDLKQRFFALDHSLKTININLIKFNWSQRIWKNQSLLQNHFMIDFQSFRT